MAAIRDSAEAPHQDGDTPDHPGPDGAVLAVRGLTKRFGAVQALQDVDVDFDGHEVHVLFGENGAGKSTLVKIIAGIHRPDGGWIRLDGQELRDLTPRRAHACGIVTVFQEPALVPQLSVAENIALGEEPVVGGRLNRGAMRVMAARALERVGSPIRADAPVLSLSRAERQVVEIARALERSARVLVLDEPTAALTDDETDRLFTIIRALREAGIAIIYITHRIREIRTIGDRISILRDGVLLRTSRVDAITDEAMITTMTGRTVEHLFPDVPLRAGRTVLRLERAHTRDLHDVSIELRAGEIVGVAGLVGSGKASIGRACFGLAPMRSGRLLVDGRPVASEAGPAQRMKAGIMYYPGDRKVDGLMHVRPARENVSLPVLGRWTTRSIIHRGAERRDVRLLLERLALRPLTPESLPGAFSGGNQQKIVLARGFAGSSMVHIFDEPTAGVDVGARSDIYELMKELVESGAGVIIISSDLPEILGLAHRVYVISEGRVVGEVEGAAMSEERVLPMFFHAHRPTVSRVSAA